MELQSDWVVRGYFDLKDPEGGASLTQRVRAKLATALGLKPSGLRVATYPVGPAWRYALWWREGNADYAEAQFFAAISPEYPILSVGISIEKGMETKSSGGPPKKSTMNRSSWDWPRLLDCSNEILETYVPACSRQLNRPVVVRFRGSGRTAASAGEREVRTFVNQGKAWYERHKGSAKPDDISAFIEDLDKRRDWWVDADFSCDMNSADVAGMTDDDLVKMLLAFAPIRQRIRKQAARG